MRKLFLCLTAAIAVAGCSSESDGPRSLTADSAQPARNALASAVEQVHARSGIAAMPDRGSLLAFDAVSAPVREGATTRYPIRLSEAHALNAAAPGRSISIATPDGRTLNFAYDSHSEDALGNWTWVGRTLEGLGAVITFGEDAVFGQIALPGTAPLQLTTRQGRTWLGVIDPSRAKSGQLLSKGRPDVMIPRVAAAAGALVAGGKAAPAQPGFAVKASPANTVDLLLGYTPGMVTAYGSASAVNTRLTNLVAVANAAYERSQITPRVRLVHTMQVNYTETNTNAAALSALSGYTCATSCTPSSVPAELQPLRTARDQYGADLVSLVRPLRAPQHDSCGIAWLIGGNEDPIDNSYAPFGYSMVSDGEDVDETDGSNYLCYVENLAHELGHNMGQEHNIQDANSPGAHSYSYGYREASTTGFFTIMAYAIVNSSQFPISYFANPSVNDAGTGRPTGTASANNALSMNQTMPLVAQFRAAVVPFAGAPRNDINGNGTSDLVWTNNGTSQMAFWLMNNTTNTGTGIFTVPSVFKVAATADLDADGRADLIWRDTSNNKHYYWRSRGDGQFDTGLIASIGTGWLVSRTGDLNGDGRSDLVWHNASTNQYAIWYMSGLNTTSLTQLLTVSSAYSLIGITDLDGDGRGDLLWDNPGIRQLYAWRNTTGTGSWAYLSLGGYSAGWAVVDTADINGDGRGDLVWQNPSAGLAAHWFMNGATKLATGVVGIPTGAAIAAVGDYNGDGFADLMIRSGSALTLRRSQGNGNYDAAASVGGVGVEWQLVR